MGIRKPKPMKVTNAFQAGYPNTEPNTSKLNQNTIKCPNPFRSRSFAGSGSSGSKTKLCSKDFSFTYREEERVIGKKCWE